jgi:hypothetical protein
MVGGLDSIREELIILLSNGWHSCRSANRSRVDNKRDHTARMLHQRLRARLTVLIAIVAVAGCTRAAESSPAVAAADSMKADSIARARQDSINRTLPGYVVDSILPVEEDLRRFRAAVGGDSAGSLKGGSASREALVRRFLRSLRAEDSSDLREMLLSAREFADLVYPESPYAHPPYRQAPGLVWSQIQNPSASGLTRLVRRLGGQPIRYVSHTCSPKPDRQGQNKLWTQCTVRLMDQEGNATSHRLFGTILQRGATFKFVSYKNDF